MTVTLRPLEESDNALMVVWRNLPEVREAFRPQPLLTEEKQAEWWQNYRVSNTDQRYVIEVEGKRVGVCGVTDIDWLHRTAHLTILIGDAKARRKGYAKAALKALFRTHRSFKSITADVYKRNTAAIALYVSLGFQKVGETEDVLVMERRR